MPDVTQELEEIQRAAGALGTPFQVLLAAFESGKLVVLDDWMWVRLGNTDSWTTTNRPRARFMAQTYGKDIDAIFDGLAADDDLPAPMVVRLEDGSLELVAGNTRLMAARAVGIRPRVLLAHVVQGSSTQAIDHPERDP